MVIEKGETGDGRGRLATEGETGDRRGETGDRRGRLVTEEEETGERRGGDW